MTNTDDDLSDMQRQFLAALPATTNELAAELEVKPTTVRYHREELDDKGVRLMKDGRSGRWTLAGHQEFTVEDTRLPDAPTLSPLTSVMLGFLTIVSPLWFVWVLELLITTSELTDSTLTFFVWAVPPLATYHLLMYLLFLINWSVGVWLIATAFFRSLAEKQTTS